MKNDEHLKWRTTNYEDLYDCRIFNLQKITSVFKKEKTAHFYRLDSPDWVTVIPLMEDPEGRRFFIMVRQYRHGSGRITVEFPAGMVETNEPPEKAASRELIEETGYQAGKLIKIGNISPNPAFMNNRCHVIFASGCAMRKAQKLDEHEEIDILQVPVEEVYDKMGTGEYDNAIMMCSLRFYEQYLRKGKGADRIRTDA